MNENPCYQKQQQELNRQLYEKAQSELTVFHKAMLAKSPEAIYEAAYEIAIKHEIAKVFVDSDYSPTCAMALLEAPNLLQDIYDEWQKGGVLTKDGIKMFTGYVAVYRKYGRRKESKKIEPER